MYKSMALLYPTTSGDPKFRNKSLERVVGSDFSQRPLGVQSFENMVMYTHGVLNKKSLIKRRRAHFT